MPEKFTENSSYTDLLRDLRAGHVLRMHERLAADKKSVMPHKLQDLPLVEVMQRAPERFTRAELDGLLMMANSFSELDGEGSENSLLLWQEPPLYQPQGGGRPYLDLYLLNHSAPAVLVIPGGGYTHVAKDHEGKAIAEAYNAQGFHAFMLRYRVYPHLYPVPQMDAIRAMQIIRGRADEWQVESGHIAVCGFSAGGHLTASLGALYDKIDMGNDEFSSINARPDALVLGYPVISFSTFSHKGSAASLLGEEATKQQMQALSVEKLVTADYPPSFIWSCAVDETVPIQNSLMLAEACARSHVPYELHLYEGGRHGVGLGEGTPAEGWLEASAQFVGRQFYVGTKQ